MLAVPIQGKSVFLSEALASPSVPRDQDPQTEAQPQSPSPKLSPETQIFCYGRERSFTEAFNELLLSAALEMDGVERFAFRAVWGLLGSSLLPILPANSLRCAQNSHIRRNYPPCTSHLPLFTPQRISKTPCPACQQHHESMIVVTLRQMTDTKSTVVLLSSRRIPWS